MSIPTVRELERDHPLPTKYRWKYGFRSPGLTRVYIQRKTHFLGLFYYQNLQWTVLNDYDDNAGHRWRLARLKRRVLNGQG